MSGTPKRGDVTLKLNQALALSKRFGQEIWNNAIEFNEAEEKSADQSGKEADSLCNSCEAIPIDVEETIRVGRSFQDESRRLREQADHIRGKAKAKISDAGYLARKIGDEIHNKFYGSFRDEKRRADECENIANAAIRLEREAIELLRQSADQAKKARESFGQVKVLIEQKQEEKRQHELKRVAATEEIKSAKSELDHFGTMFLSEWCGDAVRFAEALDLLKQSEQNLREEIFEESRQHSMRAVETLRDLYDKAIENRKRVERRNIITKAIVAALKDLNYDDPAVRYIPKKGEPSEINPQLGDLTIRADTSSGTGDMKLSINLDGNVELDVQKTKESDCRNRVSELKERIESVVDLEISDWGPIKDRFPETSVGRLEKKSHSVESENQVEQERDSDVSNSEQMGHYP